MGYKMDDSGNYYMSINILGHVKAPGAYLIHQKLGILDALSAAGGTLPGSNLNNISIYDSNGNLTKINLNAYLSGKNKIDLEFKPNDTIFIKQSAWSIFLQNTNIINTFISLMNFVLLLNNV